MQVAIRRGHVETFHDDQVVVALPALDVVTRSLSRLGVTLGRIESNAVLRLALIRDLANIDAAVRVLTEDSGVGPALERFAQERRDRGQADPAPLDLLVKGVLVQLTGRFPGWIVEIGKNYQPSFVRGYPHVGGGGDGDPVPVEIAPGGPAAGRHREPTAGRGVRVGVLDTRLFPDPGLAGRYIARAEDILDADQGEFTLFDGHCAFVSSCILQQAPAAEIHVRSVLGSDGDGSAWDAAVAIAEIAQADVDIVNLSFGEYRTDDDSAPLVLRTAVNRLGPDTVVVAAAGNNGDVANMPAKLVPRGLEPNSVSYPAALPDVIGVGALDRNGDRAAFTPHPAPWIRLLAPGVGVDGAYVRGTVNIEHTDRDGKVLDSKQVYFPGRAIWQGCSFAAAVVSGAIAARTVPGRRSAREALDELFHPAPADRDDGIQPAEPDGPGRR
jgi:membrane-anchored mycosin MYCP